MHERYKIEVKLLVYMYMHIQAYVYPYTKYNNVYFKIKTVLKNMLNNYLIIQYFQYIYMHT